jgi:hypothetical protein
LNGQTKYEVATVLLVMKARGEQKRRSGRPMTEKDIAELKAAYSVLKRLYARGDKE